MKIKPKKMCPRVCWALLVISISLSLHQFVGVDFVEAMASGRQRLCSAYHGPPESVRGTQSECENYKESEDENVMKNLPHITAAYCDTSGKTDRCRVLSGRFEFEYDIGLGKVIGPVTSGDYLTSGGVHQRVPVSFTPEGEVLTNDRVINWAITYVQNGKRLNLMNTQQFNWCKYAPENNWPYRSSFKDGKYNIYFFNRQSCIYDTETKQAQHFNTRFLHKSKLRIDLDYNPAIFAIRDTLNQKTRLIKHFRQHWYESSYEILVNPMEGLRYFIKINPDEEPPSLVNATSGPLFNRHAYRDFTDLCLSDVFQKREDKNGRLLQVECGYDQAEIADSNPVFDKITGRHSPTLVGLHTIPRYPTDVQSFFGVNVTQDDDWRMFAKDGLSFSAITSFTRPENGVNEVSSIQIFSKYLKEPPSIFDEYYPMPYLGKYEHQYDSISKSWTKTTKSEEVQRYLNYVDDIAYLHACGTVLVIFGPLYTEFKLEEFNLNQEAPIGAIVDLGLYETTNAFFADHTENNTIYFYFRLNYVAKYTYTCASREGALVTAKLVDRYRRNTGNDRYSELRQHFSQLWDLDYEYNEERFFRSLGVLKEDVPVEAPNPRDFPYLADRIPVLVNKDPTWMYYLGAAVAILVLLMAILCLFLVRRIRKRRKQRQGMGVMLTNRSGLGSTSGLSHTTRRSAMMRGGPNSNLASQRSGLTNSRGSRTSARTARSQMSASLRRQSSSAIKKGPSSRMRTSSGSSKPSSASSGSGQRTISTVRTGLSKVSTKKG